MTTTSTVSGSRIGELSEKLFNLSGNPYSQVKVKQIEGMVKKGCFSPETARGEVKMAEYFLGKDSGSSSDLTKFTGVVISQMVSLSPYSLRLVDRIQDPSNRHHWIYYRILDGEKFSEYDEEKLSTYKEKLSTYIDLMNQLIKEMESWKK